MFLKVLYKKLKEGQVTGLKPAGGKLVNSNDRGRFWFSAWGSWSIVKGVGEAKDIGL